MSLNRLSIALALPVLMGFGFTGAAQAGTYLKVTYSGTANIVEDPHGIFGGPTAGSTASFTDTFVYDLSKGSRYTSFPTDQLMGAFVSSTLVINGITRQFAGDHLSMVRVTASEPVTPGVVPYITSDAWSGHFPPEAAENHVYLDLPYVPGSLETPFSGSGSGGGLFLSCVTHCGSGGYEFYGDLHPVSVVTSTIPGVPEPAAWVLLLAGFGMIGMALRHRAAPVAA